mgnify:CR=1 FL=1|uniref:Flagellar protein FliT n=1 Tax=Ammonifex degensii TaxID=42838 RepID=A0A7C1F417_9THEO
MADESGELCTLLGRWLELVENQREAIHQRAPVETLWELIGAKEKLKEEIARALPSASGEEDSGCISLLGRILEEEEQVQKLLAVWLGDVRGKIVRLCQGREAVKGYLKRGNAPEARFVDRKR